MKKIFWQISRRCIAPYPRLPRLHLRSARPPQALHMLVGLEIPSHRKTADAYGASQLPTRDRNESKSGLASPDCLLFVFDIVFFFHILISMIDIKIFLSRLDLPPEHAFSKSARQDEPHARVFFEVGDAAPHHQSPRASPSALPRIPPLPRATIYAKIRLQRSGKFSAC